MQSLAYDRHKWEGDITMASHSLSFLTSSKEKHGGNPFTSHAPALQHLSPWFAHSARTGANSDLTLAFLS